MAGIGFELKKLFVGRGAIRRVRAYAYAGIVCSGTMLLAVVLLLGIQRLAKMFGATDSDSETLIAMMVYALIGSLLLSSVWQMLLSRFVADQLFTQTPERVLPSLFGGAILLMVPGGLVYGLFLSYAHSVPVLDRFLNWALFMELIVIWLQMAYITAAKDYRRILHVFFLGVVTALALGWLLLSLNIPILTALMAALACGYGVMMIGFTRVLLMYFPTGEGSLFAFLQWLNKTPDLVLIGLFSMAGAFVHLIVMWFGPYGETVAGLFRHAPAHDAAAFFAFLVSIPTNINFVVSVEVNFYQKYKRYFSAITDGGTLSELNLAREDMVAVLQQEIFKLAQVQVFFMVAYSVLMRYFLESIGFTREMIGMFQMMCVGYSAYAVGNSLMLLQLYFNDRKGALFTSLVFFAVNLGVTVYTMHGSPLYYGIGLTIAGGAMYVAGLLRLMTYVKKIDYHVFCGQPVLAKQKPDGWAKFLGRPNLSKPLAKAVNPKQKENGIKV
jgi:uncharacterized membrane protein